MQDVRLAKLHVRRGVAIKLDLSTMSFLQQPVTTKPIVRQIWFERLIAIVAVVNLCLVLFNLSYLPWRDFYFQEFPSLSQLYDPFKGIEPHRETQRYLQKVNELEQVIQTELQSPQVENLLEELRSLSDQMIQDNPFAGANKSGTLENIKHRMRDHVGKGSSREAFASFWSQAYLSEFGWQQEINFFNAQIQPLIKTNYYRSIGTNGKFIDRFWIIDSPFVVLFALDFLVRTFYISRHQVGLTWLEAMLRRWYDLFLLLPFWRWLRVISVMIRLYQADLLRFELIRAEIKHEFVANFAEELTEIVGIRLINQVQETIQRGDVTWLFRSDRRPYIHVNNTDELKAIAARLLNLSVYQVFPKIQPDIEALLHHSIESILNQSPVYQQLRNVPGVGHLPAQLTEKLVADISQSTYSTLTTFLEDPVVAELSNQIIQNFSSTLKVEVQKKQNIQEIQVLLVDLLEEIKINYVKGIAEEGVEKMLAESHQIRRTLHK